MIASYDPIWVGPWFRLSCQMLHDFVRTDRTDYPSAEYSEIAKARFVEHYDYVRKVVPKERLLEHRPQDGWEPLCDFLEVPVPKDEGYPNSNDSGGFVYYCTILWYIAVAKMVTKTVLPAAVAVGAFFAYRWKHA
jgi:hypothetical protein